MLPMCVRNRRQEENIDQVYCNIEGGGRSRAIKLLLSMGKLPNSFYTWKHEMTFFSISMLPRQFGRRTDIGFRWSGAPERWYRLDDKRLHMDTGTLLEQLSTRARNRGLCCTPKLFASSMYNTGLFSSTTRYKSQIGPSIENTTVLSHYQQPYGGSSKKIYWVQNIISNYAHTIQKRYPIQSCGNKTRL